MSGDDVGDQFVLERGDLVLEPQLALLEPRRLELVDRTRAQQRRDRSVEIAMLRTQKFEPAQDFAVFHARPCARKQGPPATGHRAISADRRLYGTSSATTNW